MSRQGPHKATQSKAGADGAKHCQTRSSKIGPGCVPRGRTSPGNPLPSPDKPAKSRGKRRTATGMRAAFA